ncbi:hypothetical protein EH196_19380 [Bacillus sp. C1-1]|nr:hypothetical protein EH196_19380 [Bacillus sp. C1-1]
MAIKKVKQPVISEVNEFNERKEKQRESVLEQGLGATETITDSDIKEYDDFYHITPTAEEGDIEYDEEYNQALMDNYEEDQRLAREAELEKEKATKDTNQSSELKLLNLTFDITKNGVRSQKYWFVPEADYLFKLTNIVPKETMRDSKKSMRITFSFKLYNEETECFEHDLDLGFFYSLGSNSAYAIFLSKLTSSLESGQTTLNNLVGLSGKCRIRHEQVNGKTYERMTEIQLYRKN